MLQIIMSTGHIIFQIDVPEPDEEVKDDRYIVLT